MEPEIAPKVRSLLDKWEALVNEKDGFCAQDVAERAADKAVADRAKATIRDRFNCFQLGTPTT